MCPLFNPNSSNTTQNRSSNENVQIDHESDESENEGQDDEIDVIGDGYDVEDETESDDEEPTVNSTAWIPHAINDFVPQTVRTSPRSSISPNSGTNLNPTIEELLPEFQAYRGRGGFQGPNRTIIEENNCGTSTFKFLCLFSFYFILLVPWQRFKRVHIFGFCS